MVAAGTEGSTSDEGDGGGDKGRGEAMEEVDTEADAEDDVNARVAAGGDEGSGAVDPDAKAVSP